MTVGTPRRSFSESEIAGALLAVQANNGHIEPTAQQIGVNPETLRTWARGTRRASGSAERAVLLAKEEADLTQGFLDLAKAAQKQAFGTLEKATSYQSTLIAGISYDKYLLGTGRPTSRTESLRARYVEPASLRSMALRVIDVEPVLQIETRQNRDSAPLSPPKARQTRGSRPPNRVDAPLSPQERQNHTGTRIPVDSQSQAAGGIVASSEAAVPQRGRGGQEGAGTSQFPTQQKPDFPASEEKE